MVDLDASTLYEDLVETSQDLVWQCDAEGRYTYLSSAWESAFGYTLAEMLGRKFTDFQTPDAAHRDTQAFARLLRGETLTGYETVHRARSGAEVHLVLNAKAVRAENGRVMGMRGTAHDATERRRVEAALRQSEQRHRMLVENMNQGMFLATMTGELLQVNRAAVTLLGCASADELMLLTTSKLFADPRDAERLMTTVLQQGEISDYELEAIQRDGTPHWISLNAVLLENDDGSPDRFLATFTDIAARKRMERELRQSEDQFRTLFMSLTDAFYLSEVLCDDEGNPNDYRYLEVNPRFEQVVGLPRDQIVGRRYREMVPVDTTQWLDNYFKVAATGEPRTYEFRSEEYDADFETYAYKTAAGQVAVFVRNVTARKRTEEALRNVQKLASLGVLAGGIAHDFNNLLAGVFGCIELAIEHSRDEEVVQGLATAMTAIDRARGLTRQLLTFAKGGEPEKETGSLLPFACQAARFALSGSNVSCTTLVPDGLWPCSYDPKQLGQVVESLVINAKQAMPEGGAIEISAANRMIEEGDHPTLGAGPYVRLSVQDHGIGMPRDMLGRIFDPFYTTKSEGRGLGLTTSHSIVTRHNGSIEVDSEPGKGSTFHVYLPAMPDAPVAADAAARPRHSGRGTVIVMDDEKLILNTIARILKSFGYVVVCALSGDEAISALKDQLAANQGIAFMIVDLTVPAGRGGKEIISEVRQLCPELQVFVASGYGEDPVISRPADYGFTASLCKPFTKAELADLLERHRPQGRVDPAATPR